MPAYEGFYARRESGNNLTQIRCKEMKRTRIDVHHHILPPEFVSKLNELGMTRGLGVSLPEWSPEKSLSFMKKNGIRTAVASIAVPDVVEDKTVLRDLTRWRLPLPGAINPDEAKAAYKNGILEVKMPKKEKKKKKEISIE